jgi:aspartyl-tRNA synthetase
MLQPVAVKRKGTFFSSTAFINEANATPDMVHDSRLTVADEASVIDPGRGACIWLIEQPLFSGEPAPRSGQARHAL